MNISHAVLTDTALVRSIEMDRGRKIQIIPVTTPAHIGDVCNLANAHHVTHVWVFPGLPIDTHVGEEWEAFTTYEDGDTYDDEGNLVIAGEKRKPMFARIWSKNNHDSPKGGVKIGFPEYGRWGWIIEDPVSILASIHYLEQVLGVPVEWSPGHMGIELVKHLNRTAKRQDWVRETTLDLNTLPFRKAARDILWKTGDLSDLQPGLYIHQEDKRSAYLSTCSGVYVGAGDPWHITCIDNSIDTSLPGIYRVTATRGESIYDDIVLPPIITTEWVTGDVLTYAQQQGYEVTVHECYQWTEKHKTLESYATKLWTSRRIFRDDVTRFPHKLGRGNAENTMKEIALVSFGTFATGRYTHRFMRPDWWSMVVGKTRVNILRNLHTLYDKGFTPILIYSDSVYFLSDNPNPRAAIPGILDRENELGGYKHEGTWLVTDELIEVLKTQKPGAIQKFLEYAPKIEEVYA